MDVMRKIGNKILLVAVFMLIAFSMAANDEAKLTASAPGTVIMGRPFQITYMANAKVTDFRAPAITNFDILAGPFKSESYSSQIVNGNMTSSVSITFTYTLQAQKTGTFTIPSATVTIDGQKVTSNGLSIKVLPEDDKSSSTSSSSSSSSQSSAAGSSISASNLFIRPIISRNNVFEQEAVKLTYKLYTTYDVIQFSNKSMPDFKGFLKQEFEQTGNTQLAYESYNGRNFLTAVLYEVILYPQTSGELIIDKATFEAIIRVQSKQPVRSIFDDFFESYSNVARSIEVPATRIRVKPLPQGKPVSFYGVVGQFSLTSSVSANQVKVNDAVTLKINIGGSGNMKLLKNPDIKFPDAFEVYDPKVTNNFKTSAAGLTGNKIVEIMFIPRHAGSFEIPSTEIAYFDPKENQYKTMRTPNYSIQVLKSDGTVEENPVVSNFTNKEDVKQLGNDIRHIYTGNIQLQKGEVYVFEQFVWWLLFVIPLLISFVLYLLFRKQVKDNADLNMVKNRKANRIARKRLKFAQKLLREGNKDKFYEEVMKAVWSYLSDKLIIPVAAINKEIVIEKLTSDKVSDELISRLKNILNTCEYARFAPNSGQQEMGNLYEETIDVISQLEDVIKK
ncbi:MAG: BatD family protein [Paludibacter sp.]|nr:BatD family protein [Paludibacter sp.]MDD4426798.1 BatD family protein [Paludibacter sp.]